jgi:hypothetical protein
MRNREGPLNAPYTCNVICPCWLGGDPDGGECKGILAYYIENGTVDGADVGGHTLVALAHIPGNILQGNWKVRLYIDDQASPAQRDALVDAFSGKLGGPLADIAQMVGQVTGVEQVPIRFRMTETDAALEVGAAIEASGCSCWPPSWRWKRMSPGDAAPPAPSASPSLPGAQRCCGSYVRWDERYAGVTAVPLIPDA